MRELYHEFPEANDLLALSPERLGRKVLPILRKQKGQFSLHNCALEIPFEGESYHGAPGYSLEYKEEILLALSEAFAWLKFQYLIVERPENSKGIWMVLGRKARQMEIAVDKRPGIEQSTWQLGTSLY